MSTILSGPALVGLGMVILLIGGITLVLRAVGLPHDLALYLAICAMAAGLVVLYGRLERRS